MTKAVRNELRKTSLRPGCVPLSSCGLLRWVGDLYDASAGFDVGQVDAVKDRYRSGTVNFGRLAPFQKKTVKKIFAKKFGWPIVQHVPPKEACPKPKSRAKSLNTDYRKSQRTSAGVTWNW